MIASQKQHSQKQHFSSRTKKFFSYYKSYPRLLLADLFCAVIISVIAVILPLCAGHVTGNILSSDTPDKLTQIYAMGGFMLGLVGIYTACTVFVDYQGHMMGAYMEHDMRRELFDHYQHLSFGFYDDHKTGQLMSRMTTDLFWLGELFHHGPEDIAIALFKFTGVFLVSLTINVELTLIIFAFLPFMGVYAFYFNRKMNIALRASKARIGDINAQVEDTLAGIRVVQSFTNEQIEREKFAYANRRFVETRRHGYRSEAFFYGGMIAFTQFMTIAIIIVGGAAIVNASLDLPQLITYLLYAGILIEPIQRLVNFARLYQEGITGFSRFMEMLDITPQIQEVPDAIDLTSVAGQITFENVSFRYEGGYEDVLRD
ncbi:MAG: ABC transporter ATP-binding protein, partial [Aggregatilineales bacterium]